MMAQDTQKPEPTQTPQSQATPAPDAPQTIADPVAAKAKQEVRTPGDNTFDWITYGLVGGVGNFLLSMVAGHWARYGGGAKQVGQISKSLQKAGMSHGSAEDAIMTTALMMGGNTIIVPIKMLENNRAAIVNRVNENLGCKTTVAEKEAEKSDQSWASLIKSRLIAWGIVFGSFKAAAHAFGPENFEKFEHHFATNVVCKPLGMATHVGGQETKLYKYGRIAALDVFATTASASILYIASRMLANKKEPPALATDTPVPAPETKTEESFEECRTCHTSKLVRYHHSQTERLLEQKKTTENSPTLAL